MNAAFPSGRWFPAEVLHRIGNVGIITTDAGLRQRFIQKLPGGPDERPSGDILMITRLFSNKNDACSLGTLAENRLSTSLPKIAGLTSFCGVADLGEVR